MALYCYYVKHAFFKSSFKKSNNMTINKYFRVSINFYQKLCFPVTTWDKNQPSKHVEKHVHCKKKLFAAATFECLSCLLSERGKNLQYTFV